MMNEAAGFGESGTSVLQECRVGISFVGFVAMVGGSIKYSQAARWSGHCLVLYYEYGLIVDSGRRKSLL